MGADEAPFTELWRCSVCGEHLQTMNNKSGWAYCPVCGFKISTSRASNPVDRIYNLILNKHLTVDEIVVDWKQVETTVYICHNYTPLQVQIQQLSDALEPMLFKVPQGLPSDTEFRIIQRRNLPMVEIGTERFTFFNPDTHPRWVDEVMIFKEAQNGKTLPRRSYRYLHTNPNREVSRKESST